MVFRRNIWDRRLIDLFTRAIQREVCAQSPQKDLKYDTKLTSTFEALLASRIDYINLCLSLPFKRNQTTRVRHSRHLGVRHALTFSFDAVSPLWQNNLLNKVFFLYKVNGNIKIKKTTIVRALIVF